MLKSCEICMCILKEFFAAKIEGQRDGKRSCALKQKSRNAILPLPFYGDRGIKYGE
jgi:hypothetical protein